ncbi:MAG: ATP-dependent helicase, partial [Microbacterium sp.]|nr:ATP-dependent helicase [Microbacterium sp.]
MPKNKKPAGGRPAKNFEPRYGAQTSYQDRKRQTDASGQGRPSKPGSKSPGHRGYRAETTEPSAKRRWTAQERAGRDEARAIRSHAHDDAPRRPRATDRDDARGGYRGAEPRTRGAGDRVGRDDRRSFGDGRPSYSDRPARSQGADRPTRSFDDRPRRSGDDRPARPYGDRPARSFDDRPRRSADDRPARSY